MCGIVGYIGKNSVEDNLLSALKLLEYRGYDSAGIAVKGGDGKIVETKAVGKIESLENCLKKVDGAILGIGHTRWATHGKATKNNAHPHSAKNGRWHIVHNGIIENYAELKADLVENGTEFSSQTDSEVVAWLLERESKQDNIIALVNVCRKLTGSWALACIEETSNSIYLAKNKSPLYVALGEKGAHIASDPICFNGLASSYYSLNDGEFAVVELDFVRFYNNKGEEIDKQSIKLESFECGTGKGGFDHYMIKEINETPKALARLCEVYKEATVLNNLSVETLKNINRIKIVACGTAYHSGLIGAMKLEKALKIEASCYVASEFRYSNPIITDKTLCIFVSQSGETADTLAGLELAKQCGAVTIAITNVAYSTIAKKADYVLPICAGPEIAVASTKAYVCQLAVFYCLAEFLKNKLLGVNADFVANLEKFKDDLVVNNDEEQIKEIANKFTSLDKVFFIGRGEDAVTADEASLKLKEITYINSNSYPSGELKHGFLALIEEGTPVVVICTRKELLEKTLNGANEAAARGGRIILVTPFDVEVDNYKIDYTIKLNTDNEDLLSLESVIPMQLLAYYTSINRGLDPDKPRNLAKSVTVE